MVELKEITWDNFWAVVNLKTSEAQKHYLQPNSVFMAQAYVNLKFKYDDVCFAIYDDGEVVGFTKIVFVPKDEEPYNFDKDAYFIDALMIDEKFQGKGYGKLTLEQVLAFIKTEPWGKNCSIKTACYDENITAGRLYEKFGFVREDIFVLNKQGLRLYTLN